MRVSYRSLLRQERCLEETGYEALNLSSLGVLNPNPAIFTNKLHTFIARDVKKIAEISNTSTEHTEVVLVPMDEVPQKTTFRGKLITHWSRPLCGARCF